MDAHTEKTDVQVLFEKWQAGDEQARDRLFEVCLHTWRTAATIELMNGDVHGRPSDFVQQVVEDMLRWERKNRFNDFDHFQRTFRKILNHRIIDMQRKVVRRQETPFAGVKPAKARGGSTLPEWTPSDHKNDPTRNSIIKHLDEAISWLPPKEQQALQLYYRHGLTEAEVAAEMGCGERWVRELLTRAETFLKQWFAEYRHPATNGVPRGYGYQKQLGSGGCGEVWEVTGSPRGRTAIRVVRVKIHTHDMLSRPLSAPHPASDTGWNLIINLQHPNIVDVYQIVVLVQHGLSIVEMELVQPNLKEVLRDQGPIPRELLLGYMWDAACGIDALTKRAIIHRDIKPENLGLRDGRVKLLDFGFARTVLDWVPEEYRLTPLWDTLDLPKPPPADDEQGMTTEFAPPEFFSKQVAKTSDQYSLGKSYLELRTGRPASMWRKNWKNPTDLKQLPPPEQTVVRRCLNADPEQRWPDCCTFVRELVWASKANLPDSLLKMIASEPEDAKDPKTPIVHFGGDNGLYTSNEDLRNYTKRGGTHPDGGLPPEWQ